MRSAAVAFLMKREEFMIVYSMKTSSLISIQARYEIFFKTSLAFLCIISKVRSQIGMFPVLLAFYPFFLMKMIQHVTSKMEFEQTLKSFDGVLLVDFFATWCGPCKMLAPVMENLAEQYDTNKVKILKVDVDQVPELAQEYGIVSIPTVFIGKNHQLEESFLGAYPKEFYEEKIATYQNNLTPSA